MKTLSIVYIGKRKSKKDQLYGSGASFFPDDPQEIEYQAAVNMVTQHPDCWITEKEWTERRSDVEANEDSVSVNGHPNMNVEPEPKQTDPLAAVAEELESLPNMPAIKEWAETHELTLPGGIKGRDQLEAAVLDAYKASLGV